jgi:hypothetical protein
VTLPDCSDVDPGVYGALATVAAITTALQSVVAILPLQRSMELGDLTDNPVQGTAIYNDAKKAARRDFWRHGMLNAVAVLINGCVLAAWFKVGVYAARPDQWEYWLPWCAVAVGALALTITAVLSLWKLRRIAHLS